MRSVLALRSVCGEAEIPLQLDLGGGEALASRGHAGMMARFLETRATHLLLCDGDEALEPDAVLQGVASPEALVRLAERQLLIRRDAAEQVSQGPDVSAAGLSDVRGVVAAPVAMAYESIVKDDRYLSDLEAFTRRWSAVIGARWAHAVNPEEG